jgi:hypothetical protein
MELHKLLASEQTLITVVLKNLKIMETWLASKDTVITCWTLSTS